ncbi:mannosylphosphorylation of N-linked oligosaccharides effector, putative [Candida dubliniensis CD36]|uniref:Mannosylphosphorylation of N-linked oligosaccharides effector, putative n=1 Tax=Candida dubliniensis (strain CD36 / ATCC MYA-646 / CBS 7987 / NCPF 3949 / NRRL Y-17841) TaxID=573826 RepID=B9W751_CANDC|nr:mannosylphosphorylation of N-linked oligosaccharides effector, putative [Candida dubliniensis CD36]CAX44510.1 mannosylphosphorylation of N-linked oligosaccharides effector, putative [Candida dubliniensis CD36]
MKWLLVARGVSFVMHFKVLQLLVAGIVGFNIYLAATNVVNNDISNHETIKLPVQSTQSDVSSLFTTDKSNSNFENKEQISTNSGFILPTLITIPTNNRHKPSSKPKYLVPNSPYDKLSFKDKILFKLNEVGFNKDKYQLTSSESMGRHKIEVRVNEFTREMWDNNPGIFFDPRFTLSVYLAEIKRQLRENALTRPNHGIVLPFSWTDWVDLTMLNDELMKPEGQRMSCEDLKAAHDSSSKYPYYCINNEDIDDQELEIIGLPSTNYVPGYAVRKSPTNKASNVVRMLEGKSHLLTYADIPTKLVFLNKQGGIYMAEINKKQRIIESGLFNNFVKFNYAGSGIPETIILDPIKEFETLLEMNEPQKWSGAYDRQNSTCSITSTDYEVPAMVFDYPQNEFLDDIRKYGDRLDSLHDLTTNELRFDSHEISNLRLNRNEMRYYESLQYANVRKNMQEPVYFRHARLITKIEENKRDSGWNYDWRFFNGALDYLKQGWTEEQLMTRRQIILDRLLRNWTRFVNEGGFIWWISQSSLMSWYWNGQLSPFLQKVEIQMPIKDLLRLALTYNQTMVVEDVTEGFGKYFVDCSTFVHYRGSAKSGNRIDAKFIDVDTGLSIEIGGVSTSFDAAPERSTNTVTESQQHGQSTQVYNTRHPRFYSSDEISPLRKSMFAGTPVYVPNNISAILNREYHKKLIPFNAYSYYFVTQLNLWIHHSKLKMLFEKSENTSLTLENNKINATEFCELTATIDDEQIVELLTRHEDILLEYYLTKDLGDLHKKELACLLEHQNEIDNARVCDKMANIRESKHRAVVVSDPEYRELVASFSFQTPKRVSLFDYEQLERSEIT